VDQKLAVKKNSLNEIECADSENRCTILLKPDESEKSEETMDYSTSPDVHENDHGQTSSMHTASNDSDPEKCISK
jgi:hypothetical protein